MIRSSVLAPVLAAVLLAAAPAQATTGTGCWRPAVGVNELTVHVLPSAGARVLGRFDAARAPIIAGGTGAAEAEARCEIRKRGERWCIVTIYDGVGPLKGFVPRARLAPSECP